MFQGHLMLRMSAGLVAHCLRAPYVLPATACKPAMLLLILDCSQAVCFSLMLQVLDEKYYAGFLNLVQPRQRDVTHVLAALVMVSCAMLDPVNIGYHKAQLHSIAACHCSVASMPAAAPRLQ